MQARILNMAFDVKKGAGKITNRIPRSPISVDYKN